MQWVVEHYAAKHNVVDISVPNGGQRETFDVPSRVVDLF